MRLSERFNTLCEFRDAFRKVLSVPVLSASATTEIEGLLNTVEYDLKELVSANDGVILN